MPGHTVDSFPAQVESILADGHEIAHHSYAHIDPSGQKPQDERADMELALRSLERVGVIDGVEYGYAFDAVSEGRTTWMLAMTFSGLARS